MEPETNVLGIPVPSSGPLFIGIVVIHIFLGIICVGSGLVAMLSSKRRGSHTKFGNVYYISLLLIFITVLPLSIMRWPLNNHLLILGTMSFVSAYYGRRLARRPVGLWTRIHTILMGASYILLLTAFYVDNGKNLPVWNLLPQYSFWIIPSAIGIPILLYTLFNHPLNKRH